LEITDTDWIETQSEIDALFLEAEMIRRYMPRYNILLRDDKSLSYVRIDHKSEVPTVAFTRRPLDDGAEYIGPFVNGWAVRRALKYLRRVFPYFGKQSSVNSHQLKSKLPEQIGLEPKVSSPEEIKQYKTNLKMLSKYMRGEKVDLTKQLEREMKLAAREQRFEEAAYYRNRLSAMKGLGKQIIFSDREFLDLSKDEGLNGLASLLGLQKPPRRIEGYDISHMSGKDTVASMVVFEQGMPNKAAYRKFKMRLPGNDDFAHMREVITRRLSEKHVRDWGLPELFLIDGGKGQLAAALEARETLINNTITHLKVNPSTQNNRDKTTFQGLRVCQTRRLTENSK
jgi:excinuclease ABC subunit C